MAYHYAYDCEEKKPQVTELATNRSMWKLMLLTILTLGVYSIIFFIPFSFDLEKVDPQRNRTKPMSYLAAYVLSLFTFSIVIVVWHYQIAERVEVALSKHNVDYDFDTDAFWAWYVFGSFILIGQFVYFYKLCKAMNALCAHYNESQTAK